MSQIIPRTDTIESIINTRNKFLFGSDVHVGDEFSGWEDTYTPCSPIMPSLSFSSRTHRSRWTQMVWQRARSMK